MKAIVARPGPPEGLSIEDVGDAAEPSHAEAVVRTTAISLNQGEVRHAFDPASDGARPGWDFTGQVEHAAANGEGPRVGDRVVGFVENGAWCERVVAPAGNLTVIPAEVSDTIAASLPVAGLTALYTLAEGGLLLGKRVLVNGASGGVGHLALHLARAAGAQVVAAVRKPDQVDTAKSDGAGEVWVTEDLASAKAAGPFDLILESVGGPALGNALSLLAGGGACVSFGNSSQAPTTFNVYDFFLPQGRKRLIGFYLLPVLRREPAGLGLGRLITAVQAGQLTPRIEVEDDWTKIGAIARQYLDRTITGKVVLHVR